MTDEDIMFEAVDRINELVKRTYTLVIWVVLIWMTGCTINPCLDEAVLYGKINDEVICYQEKKVKHGPHTKWFPDSEVKEFERNYKNDILEGPYKEWYSNGKLKIEANYRDGKLEGTYTQYYSNGQKRVFGRYSDNVRVGVYTEFYKNGQKKLYYNFNPIGKPEGKQIRYRMNGFPLSEYTYYEGKMVGRRFWRNDGSQDSVLSHR